jgi:flagellar basal-body rod modification protein FlgD
MSIDTSTISGASQSTTHQPPDAQGSNALGKDEFLKILTTQLAHQDPTKPMDDTAFVSQLAQFSTLEQMQNSNDTLTQLLALQKLSGQTAMVPMVGKTAIYNSNAMDLSVGGTISVNATLASPATDVILEIDDADGKAVRRQSCGAKSAGNQTLTWDGKNENGIVQSPGTYHVSVSATDIGGKAVSVTQQSSALITGVSFQNGTSQLMLGNTPISLGDVIAIQQPASSPSNNQFNSK